MFRGLFGSKKSQSPAPPKNQIEVVCPACGAAQYEPRLVVSTFCKRCGVHLTIEKKRVIASEVSKAGGRPDALAPSRTAEATPAPISPAIGKSIPAPVVAAPALKPMAQATGPTEAEDLPSIADLSDTGELGLGMMMQAVSSPGGAQSVPLREVDPPVSEPVPLPAPLPTAMQAAAPVTNGETDSATPRVASNVPMAIAELMQTPVQAPATPGTLQKMMDQGVYRQQYFKEAQCFECNNKFKVGRSSKSANCPSCGSLISLEDIELNMPSNQAIKTRGDVLIRKRGHLTAAYLYAKDLRCYGMVQTNVFCSGDAIFKTEGTMVGEVHCRRFIVEKGSEITFMNPIHADEVEIHSPITGNVFSKGSVQIFANGAVNGDVTARSVSIEPGGELNGSMNIVRSAR